jgi:hypothetical protein
VALGTWSAMLVIAVNKKVPVLLVLRIRVL